MNTKGFTLIEIIIVVVIFGFLLAASIVFFQSFQTTYQLNASVEELSQNLRRAQNLARTSQDDSKYGIYLNAGTGESYVLFKGNTYSVRDQDFDEVYDLSPVLTLNYSLGGSNQIIFSKLRGLPGVTGTITITNSNNESKIIEINEQGRIKIQ